jgi:hypothetical protein
MTRFYLITATILMMFVGGSTQSANADARSSSCAATLEALAVRLEPDNHHGNQGVIIEHAKTHGLPAFLISIPAGENVPVVLLNKHTIQAWSPILEQTVGLNQSLHTGNLANHGWLRLPGKVVFDQFNSTPAKLYEDGAPEAAIADLFSPGQSSDRALHGTGYRWMWLASYFNRRHPDSFVHIEQVFALSREDQIKVWLYHLVKRSALVRIQYMFDTLNNDWINGQRRVLQQDGQYRRRSAGEHCNNCRVGTAAPGHAGEMRGRMSWLFNKDVNLIYSLGETHRFLDDAKKKLMYRDWRNGEDLHPDLMNDDYFIGLMRAHFREGLSREQQVDALSYLLATNIFEEVVLLKQKYGMEEEVAMTLNNNKMSAFFVYSDLYDSPESFYKGMFEYFGANGAGFSSSWPGLNPRPLFNPWPDKWWEKWRPR